VLATVPVLEMGVNDDWSFAYVARRLAFTGRIAYTNWSEPMIGVQAFWGAALIRLFGFSFTLLRLSTLPFAAGSGLVLYKLGRRSGLNTSYALFGALSVMLSPLVLPLAASFMTDIPAFFFWLVCFYCAIRARQTPDAIRASGWMAAAAATGVAGGTVRQVVWIAPLALLPAVAWIRRRDRPLAAAAAALWCAAALTIAICLRWFYALVPARLLSGEIVLQAQDWRLVLGGTLQAVVTGMLLVLPVLSIFLADWRRWARAPLTLIPSLLAPGALLCAVRWLFHVGLLLGNIVTKTGVLVEGTEAMGRKPLTLTGLARGLLALALALGAGAAAASVFGGIRAGKRAGGALPAARPAFAGPGLSFPLAAPPFVLYALAVLCRLVADGTLLDRYLIPLLPAAVILLLWRCQQGIRPKPSALGWGMLGLFAVYGVATTHDYLATGRARLRAATAVTAAGVPRTRITAGLEYDGWTELDQSGRVSSGDNPAAHKVPYPVSPPYWFWDVTPSIEPRYFVAYSRLDGLVDSPFPPVAYSTWLPPTHRTVLTQMAP
jgi:hypothetical protein